MTKNVIIKFSTYSLSVVFIMVGMSKLMGHGDFVKTLGESPIVKHFVPLIAYPLPVIEVLVGLALLIPVSRRYAMLASLVMMVVFTLYNIYLVKFAPYVPCSCGGIFKDMSWTSHLYINTLLTILAAISSWYSWQSTQDRTTSLSTIFTSKKRRSIGTE